jgi:hypothetical protein
MGPLLLIHCYADNSKDCLAATKDRSALFILATKYNKRGGGPEGGGTGAKHTGLLDNVQQGCMQLNIGVLDNEDCRALQQEEGSKGRLH